MTNEKILEEFDDKSEKLDQARTEERKRFKEELIGIVPRINGCPPPEGGENSFASMYGFNACREQVLKNIKALCRY